MKDFLKKFCPIAAKILSVPIPFFLVFSGMLELFGFEKVDGFLSSLQLPFRSEQILTVGGVIFLLWLFCFCVKEWFMAKDKRAADEAEAIARCAASFDPGRSDTPLRTAARDVKCRILLEYTVGGYRICYRRVKRTNELVINGQVYDEYVALVEHEHTLFATLDGHTYAVGTTNSQRMFIEVDDQIVAKKMRWI